MLEYEDPYKMLKIDAAKVSAIGTKSEMIEFIRQSPGDTYYNFNDTKQITFTIGEDDFKYRDKKACRVKINDTLFSKEKIDRIIEYTEGKKMITKDGKRPYKRVIGNKYDFTIVNVKQPNQPLILTRADEEDDRWFIIAPIIDDESDKAEYTGY